MIRTAVYLPSMGPYIKPVVTRSKYGTRTAYRLQTPGMSLDEILDLTAVVFRFFKYHMCDAASVYIHQVYIIQDDCLDSVLLVHVVDLDLVLYVVFIDPFAAVADLFLPH